MQTIRQNVPLADYSTMRLGGVAKFLVEIKDEEDLLAALDFAKSQDIAVHVVGGGSNTVFTDNGFDGLVIINKITGIKQVDDGEDVLLTVGGGEVWDDVVKLSTDLGFYDIAALSLIPGTAGAAPVQNIGAYGQQFSDSAVSVRAYDKNQAKFVDILRQDCNFTYRASRFNGEDRSRFIITSVIMRLHRKKVQRPFYDDISRYFDEHGINQDSVSPQELREAVSTVRVIKLPDPSSVANCGSFFKNPIVDATHYENLLQKYPELKAHRTDDGKLKIYGGQLIEMVGLKDYHDSKTGMATWKNHALVVVNESAESTKDLLEFKEKIVSSVRDKFDITLVQEPELIGS